MNKLNKDLLFYSNYCLHSNNLINTISKTGLHENMIYICIDEKKVKVPSFITRVPTVYLVKDKKILVEDDIDRWFENKNKANNLYNQQQQQHNQQQQQHNQQQQQHNQQQQQHNQQQQQNPQQHQQQQNRQQQQNPQQEKKTQEDDEGIMAYHNNEMGGSLSNNYSFISDDNSTLNHNFEFLDGTNDIDSRINTPKEFSGSNNQVKSQTDTDFDKLMAARNNDNFGKGVERI
jgi:hypothetical protein